MPNWTSNKLTISGQAEDIARFKKRAKAKGTALSLNRLRTIPKKLLTVQSPPNIVSEEEYETVKARIDEENKKHPMFTLGYPLTQRISDEYLTKYGANNWYNWNIKHWGTKWDVEATLLRESETMLYYEFESAWSPPIEWLKHVGKTHPTFTLYLEYRETGIGFSGEAMVIDGELEYNNTRSFTAEDGAEYEAE